MRNTFSSQDITRLIQLAERISERRDCPASEAVDMIHYAVEKPGSAAPRPRRTPAQFADRARRIRGERQTRLGLSVFGEPAWDMMLDLLVAKEQDRRMSVTDLCLGAGVPPTTALRHVDLLVRQNVIERTPDPRDGRRWFVRLNEQVNSPLTEVVTELQEAA